MVHVDGVVRMDGEYKGFSWVPSVGRVFDRNNWNQWREISIRIGEDADEEVTFSHEVWDHEANCPIHDVGVVIVSSNNGNGNGNNGNGNNGGGTDGNGNNGGGTDGNGNNVDGNGGGGPIDTDNNAPVFSDSSATRELQENIGDATVTTAANLGAAIRADDSDNDPLTYTLEGSDSASFTIVEQTGQLRTKAGVNYNHEAKSTYRFTIRASDGTASDTIAGRVGGVVAEPLPRSCGRNAHCCVPPAQIRTWSLNHPAPTSGA